MVNDDVLHCNRTEFVPSERLNGGEYALEYTREGGWFVTTKKALFLAFLAVSAIVVAVALMYFYGPSGGDHQKANESADLEELLLHSANTIRRKGAPKNLFFRPFHYRLRIYPIVDPSSFRGAVEINLLCVKKTKTISLNSENLNIDKDNVDVMKTRNEAENANTSNANLLQEKLRIKRKSYDENDATYRITMDSHLEENVNYTLRIVYSGNVQTNFIGLYRTYYKNTKNESRWLMGTNLQPSYARRVFPCFDEPQFRTSFELSLARRTNMTTLSNMPLVETTSVLNASGWVWDHFEKSPAMPTHLLGFVICDLESVTGSAFAGPVIKTWVISEHLGATGYALSIGQKMVEFLQRYFDVKFPLPKIDFVVIPNLTRRSVNSWGLVCFRDSSFLLEDPQQQSIIFETIAREIIHQWIGDLVGVDSWSNAWLTEGFTIYLTSLMQNNLLSKDDGRFWVRTAEEVLHEDTFKTTTSLTRYTVNQFETGDDVLNRKAALLLKMLRDAISENAFKDSLKTYLDKWSYISASPDDLWKSFATEEVENALLKNNVTLNQFIQSWTSQPGYPVVNVNAQNHSVMITQRRLTEMNNEGTDERWTVPIQYVVSTNMSSTNTLWLQHHLHKDTENAKQLKNDTWVLFSFNQTALYRVNYSQHNWGLLQGQLQHNYSLIPVVNRAQLLNDALELAALGALNYDVALNLTTYLVLENHYVPWAATFEGFKDVRIAISNTHYEGVFKEYVIKLTKPLFNKMKIEDKTQNSEVDEELRSLILEILCQLQYEGCVSWAKRLYEQWMNSTEDNPIPYSVRQTVLCAAVSAGQQKEWEFLWRYTLSSNRSSYDLEIAYLGLGCSRQSWLINKYLELSLQGNVSVQNVPYVWKSLRTHPGGVTAGFKFLRSNWERIYAAYKSNFGVIKEIAQHFLSHLSTKVDLEDLTTFYRKEEQDLSDISSLILRAVDKIKYRIQWSSKHLSDVVGWMKKYAKS